MTTADEFAVQIALKRGLVTAGQLSAAQKRAAGHADLSTAASGLLDILAADAALDQETLGRAMADEFGMPWVVLAGRTIPAAILAALPRSFVAEHNVLPYAREDGMLRVAVADPIAVDVIDSLGHLSGTAVQPVLASAADIRQAIARHYSHDRTEVGPELAAESFPTDRAGSGEEGQASAQDAPIISLVQNLIAEAVRRRASDIHLEPLERRFRVRYRIDGMLLEVESPPKRLQLAIISRLKIMANISIAEKRVPQDGRIQVKLGGRSLDLRVSSLPTAHGESIVMRILDQEGLKLGLPELGFLPDDQKAFEQTIASPDGIMLVTGPTGSGKTTTLYASLHQLNQPDRKIITVEEPVEYQLAGINQVPVNAAIGMTFAAALRAMLRQAPNIVMVGEIRDRETAEIAINASLTGHMVFSTLHTNDAPSAVTRLIDIGAKPFLVAAALRSVMAQRLVRRICPACKRPHTPSARELHALGCQSGQLERADFAHGAGCAACNGTGYQGRMGIFEIFRADDGIRAMIYDNVTSAALRAQARRAGMRTMREDGIRKVLAGLTTIEEVVTVTVGDPL
ncbi:MAG TPA: ATPase, T2SS/T4P/T4SS family [Lacunisphaera sp.]|nr:ATPase, T2SS/T4P/T4SS family [Lacunisphaera sp.]